ncbi:Carbohydrate binding module (family 35) [Ruminococcus sp. YE71]|uniref:glycosyl hydrolase n=1 Tax=unclassified Ruminococcus TaxID=2608920 RepID=UPI00088EFF48|nr:MULTISPECIES: glycosyl hydrolase [unclassified Ruminococcus]SDA29872.1 Carbohydrate binding module (family 35) [Ruminococcus sp. YE78]SFW48978.1 Carbohydrate binding module (family 35) [Ruminococcus sp. YE71]
MKISLKRVLAALAASAVSATSVSGMMPVVAVEAGSASADAFPFVIEGEDMEGASLWTQNYGPAPKDSSGDGFFYLTGSSASFTVNVPEDGMYTIVARAAQTLDKNGRQESVCVNGIKRMLNMPYSEEWMDFSFGSFRLNKGVNTIEFISEYGYMAIDKVTVSATPKHDYTLADGDLTDKKATPEAKSLMAYLKSVYGKHIIAGQQEIYGGGHGGNYEWENEFLENLTGKVPAIRGVDFMNYNPLYGWDDGTTERCIEWATERNGIITASWHINIPKDFENYTLGERVDWKGCTYKNYQSGEGSQSFDTRNVVIEGTKEYDYFQLAIKDLAEQLTRLQDAGVPVIWRPLHEAQGNEGNYSDGTAWFWWGDRGAETYKEIWKLLYNTLTEEYGLHNLIWEFNSYDYSNSATWYPGDDYVDIVAYDKYNVEYNRGDGKSSGPNLLAIPAKFDSLYALTNGKKMIAMAENDTIPALDNLVVEDAGWLYFCPWYDGGEDGGTAFLGTAYQDHDELKKIYQSEYCITLDELPVDLYKNGGTTVEDNAYLYGDANCDGYVDIADAVLVTKYVADPANTTISAQGLKNADCVDSGKGVDERDAYAIQLVVSEILDPKSLPAANNSLPVINVAE